MESYYNFYYNNEESIKKYMKYVGYGGAAFFGGFALFSLFNYKKAPKAIENEIPQVKEMKVEEIRKFLRKLINYVLLNLSQSFDRVGIKRLEQFLDIPSETLEQSLSSFIGNNIEIESVKVDEPKKLENSTVIIPQEIPGLDGPAKEDAKKISFEDVKAIVSSNIRLEVTLLKKYGIDGVLYSHSIKKHAGDELVKANLEILRNFYRSYLNREAYVMNFHEDLKTKYFLVITNIYYFCIRSSCVFFKENHLDNVPISELDTSKLGLFSVIYKKKLKEVRKSVMEAFGVQNQYNNVSTKLLLRMLPHYYDVNSNFRKKTILVKKTVDEILYYLEDRRPGQENILQKIEKIVSLTDKIDTHNEIDLASLLTPEMHATIQKKYQDEVNMNKHFVK